MCLISIVPIGISFCKKDLTFFIKLAKYGVGAIFIYACMIIYCVTENIVTGRL